MDEYVVWGTEEIPRGLVLDQLEEVDLDVELKTGIPCADTFPDNAVFTADPDFPDRIRLADTFDNTAALVVISQKLRDFIETYKPKEVEFLPVTVLNHKSRPAGKYFIVHPIDPVDALKPAASGAKWAKDLEDWIDSVKKIVLDPQKIDKSRLLFKLKYFYDCVLVRRDLAEAITKQKFTGINWIECSEYKSI